MDLRRDLGSDVAVVIAVAIYRFLAFLLMSAVYA
jgi:hypothetical protein